MVATTAAIGRAASTAQGRSNVPLRATEYGFATGGVREWVTDPACQAALIAATTRELAARRPEFGLRSIGQFMWQDRAGTSWPSFAGLLYADGTAKPSLRTFTDAIAGRAPTLTVPAVCAAQHQG